MSLNCYFDAVETDSPQELASSLAGITHNRETLEIIGWMEKEVSLGDGKAKNARLSNFVGENRPYNKQDCRLSFEGISYCLADFKFLPGCCCLGEQIISLPYCLAQDISSNTLFWKFSLAEYSIAYFMPDNKVTIYDRVSPR
ncbi:hypothetical protein G9A89_007535 [Geosiphon pyriformis]|nr:hypothetical protein G9A89_007535 [Geosiphon pyriformis]